ncbi:MAG: Uma2 family endonuclease [SAR202 cluster bacterium]|nr:Uma2 family endonuclease [SAR202 cluster bacterium]
MTTQKTKLLTAEEFFQLYSSKEGHFELVKGEVVEMPPPGWNHGGVASNISSELRFFVRRHDLGRVVVETGFRLMSQPDNVRGPDAAFVVTERVPEPGFSGYFQGPPDLAVEVVSPNDTASALDEQVQEYLRSGAQRVWVVYPATRTVVVYRSDSTA